MPLRTEGELQDPKILQGPDSGWTPDPVRQMRIEPVHDLLHPERHDPGVHHLLYLQMILGWIQTAPGLRLMRGGGVPTGLIGFPFALGGKWFGLPVVGGILLLLDLPVGAGSVSRVLRKLGNMECLWACNYTLCEQEMSSLCMAQSAG